MAKEGSHPRNRGARVYNSANISIPNAAMTALTFDSERFDTDGIHSTTTNTSRLTCKTAGKYLIIGEIAMTPNATGVRALAIYKNGGTKIAQVDVYGAATEYANIVTATIWDLAVDDYVELDIYQSSGGALSVLNDGSYTPEFMMMRLV